MALRSRVDRLAAKLGERARASAPYWPPMVTVAVRPDGSRSSEGEERIHLALLAARASGGRPEHGRPAIIIAQVPIAALDDD